MKTIHKIFFLFILFYFSVFLTDRAEVFSQNKNIDSLQALIKNDKIDTNKVNHLNDLSETYINIGSYDTAMSYGSSALQLSQQLNFKRGIGSAYNNIGLIYLYQGNYPEALKNHMAALKIHERIASKKGLVNSYNNLGFTYYSQGNYPEALRNYRASLTISEEIRDKGSIASLYNNIGVINKEQGNYSEALKNHFAALKIAEQIKNRRVIAACYNNIGNIFFQQDKYPDALKNYNEALKISKEIKDKHNTASFYANIGHVFYEQGNHTEALKMLLAALKIKEEIGDKEGIAHSLNNIGTIYEDQLNYSEALKHYFASLKIEEEIGSKRLIVISCLNIASAQMKLNNLKEATNFLSRSLQLAKEMGYKKGIRDSYKNLTKLDSMQSNWKAAFQHCQLYTAYRDSINNEETNKKTVQTAMTYEFEKKELITKAIYEREKQLAQYQKYALIGFIAVVFLLAFFLINRQQIKIKKQKQIYQMKQQLDQSELKRKEVETTQLQLNLKINQEKLNSYTNLIKEKTRIIDALEKQFETIKLTNTSTPPSAEQLLTIIKENKPPEEYWEKFITNFNLVNTNFFDQLTKTFPELTRNELNYCALIKCNLSNKEIASILNISPDSAKRARNRLKKKLNLDAENSLSQYIASLK